MPNLMGIMNNMTKAIIEGRFGFSGDPVNYRQYYAPLIENGVGLTYRSM